MKHLISIFSIAMILLLQVQEAKSQISITSKTSRKQYLAYESVKVSLTIKNMAGVPINFVNKLNNKWVEFVVRKTSGKSVYAFKKNNYSPMRLESGQSKTSTFRLNDSYDLSAPGNYFVYAVLRMPGQTASEGFKSQKSFFTIINSLPSWKQRAGVPGAAGDTREYRLYNIVTGGATELYVQVEDVKRGKMLASYSLGLNIALRPYSATLDKNNRLNVLFQTTPTVYSHTVVDAAGKIIRREYHKKGPRGKLPSLITTGSGVVGVVNSTYYDPQKEKDKLRKIHNLSELPLGLGV